MYRVTVGPIDRAAMDADLRKDVIKKATIQLCLCRPDDPVEFLRMFLFDEFPAYCLEKEEDQAIERPLEPSLRSLEDANNNPKKRTCRIAFGEETVGEIEVDE
ncbi:hypothetical protein M3Y99_00445800 [Aphelenchoides fujianensis]|nr:hypothetical protein M3Y99_00445800 [Aphelenchoides fujianensis]